MRILKHLCLWLACFNIIANAAANDELDLSGPWNFSTDENYASTKNWRLPDFDSSAWETLPVPVS